MYSPDMKEFRYKCGLAPGNTLRLKKPLEIQRLDGTAVSTDLPGLVWQVLAPGYEVISQTWNDAIVWLREPNGRDHTWNDDDSIFEYFEVID
jgi:hypothetical protein